jgi:internalin A
MTDSEIITSEPKPPKRRLLRLSVRALMVIVLILAVVLGWFVRRAMIQREAVLAIKKSGGQVYYDWQRRAGGGLNPSAEPIWPRWLIERVGIDYFGHVVMVGLGKSATDLEMAHVGRLPRLVTLNAPNVKEITDAGAAHLAGLADLESVSLSGSKVTGGALANFRGKTTLKFLFIDHLPITDADLVHLEGLTNLEILDLTATKVGDAGLAHLEGLVNIKTLRLGSTQIEGPGLAHLKRMSKLSRLRFEKTRVRDLSTLPRLPGLLWLWLDDTPLDDAGLANIPDLPALEDLHISRTAATEACLPRLLVFQKTLKSLLLGNLAITDAAAPTLVKFDHLTVLLLEGSKQVTDATLDQLAQMKQLRIIKLDGTSTTEAGLARLKQALPELRTWREVIAASRVRAQAASKNQPQTPGTPP